MVGEKEAEAQDAEIGGNSGERIGGEKERNRKWNEALTLKAHLSLVADFLQ